MAKSALEKQIIELKDTIAGLNKTMASLQASLDAALAREEEHIQREENLREQVAYLTGKLYGSSSEKKRAEIDGQLNLFDEIEGLSDGTADDSGDDGSDEDASETVTFTRKKKTTIKDKFSNLPVVKRLVDIPEEERICRECGSPLSRVGEEFLRYELEFTPAKAKIVEYYRVSYECRRCKKESGVPHIVKGYDGMPHMIHGMASAQTVAWVMYQKYVNSIPLYRREKDWKIYGCDLDRATMANWVILNAEAYFKPMCGFFGRHIKARPYAMADETPVQVLREKGRPPTSKSYMWVFRTGEFLDKPAIVFRYAPTRSGYIAEEFFEDYTGYLMCDGFSGYNAVKEIKRTGCFAHARRYLLDAVPKKNQMDFSIPAIQVAAYIDKLFAIEQKIHSQPHTADEIKELRLKQEAPVLESMWAWLDKQQAVKGSKFHKAIVYLHNQKPFLERYLEDGNCSFSNNASERCCKDFVVGRKNWLFSDSTKGADASAYIYSIVQTAKANDVNSYHYLCFLLESEPSSQMSDDELEKLAPWNAEVKAEIKRREEISQKD